ALLLQSYGYLRDLHSFPTRRSSDLTLRKSLTDTPTDADLFGPTGLVPKKPRCPSGGTYTLNAGDANPTCSVAEHVLAALQVGFRSEEHTSELQSRGHLVCRLLLEKK